MNSKDYSNKGIMKRLDDLEKRNSLTSATFLLYSLAIAFVLGYYSNKTELHLLILGAVCYFFGATLPSIMRKFKRK